ncbi:MAG: hypothetical protein Q4C22_07160, partial [Bacillota bacterium]|nr:hypothetical protein [Bacillota bacterium]
AVLAAVALLAADPPETVQSSREQAALEELAASLSFSENQLTFVIPESYPDVEKWNIHIAGRQEYSDGFSSSVHYLEDVAYEAGQKYVILEDYGQDNHGYGQSTYSELTLTASFSGLSEESPELRVDLVPYLNAPRPDRSAEIPVPLSELPTALYGTFEPDWENDTVWLLARLPEEEVYVYGLNVNSNGRGVFVRWRESTYYAESWHYITPRQILPQAACGDYDGDGEQELALSFCIDSGTGVSVADLHIFERAPDGTLTSRQFERGEYLSLVNEALSWEHDQTAAAVTAYVDGHSTLLSLDPQLTGEFDGLAVNGSMVTFELSGPQPGAVFGINTLYEDGPYLIYCGELRADVRYEDGAFSMENFTVIPY